MFLFLNSYFRVVRGFGGLTGLGFEQRQRLFMLFKHIEGLVFGRNLTAHFLRLKFLW